MTDTNTQTAKIKSRKRRTIVGSPPNRRVLRGREAIERALRLCKRGRPPDEGENYVAWLPLLVRGLELEQLEHLLAGGTVYGRGIDEVAP